MDGQEVKNIRVGAAKQELVRSNTRGVYVTDKDDEWVAGLESVQKLAESIEKRRVEMGKTSGFERLYGRVTKLYFGGMARHLASLRECLKPGAQLAYVVGDQASYLRVMIRTGEVLGEMDGELGLRGGGERSVSDADGNQEWGTIERRSAGTKVEGLGLKMAKSEGKEARMQ